VRGEKEATHGPTVRQRPEPLTSVIGKNSNIGLQRSVEYYQVIRGFSEYRHSTTESPRWHGSYAKPKSKSYISMATILPKLPHEPHPSQYLSEADYRREAVSPLFFKKVGLKTHLCIDMARQFQHWNISYILVESATRSSTNAAKLSNPRSHDSRALT